MTDTASHIFFGMVGAVGSGVSSAAGLFKERLEREYGYEVKIQKLSDFITSSALGKLGGLDRATVEQKTLWYQTCGNELRRKFGDDYFARRCMDTVKGTGAHNLRTAFIFDSIKHPSELALLRKVLGGRFFSVTVFAPARVRRARLQALGVPEKVVDEIFVRDEHEVEKHGQKVRETAYLCDFFIRNDANNKVKIALTIERYLSIIFGVSVHTLTFDEIGMSRAFGAAMGSACLSRQVGAAVYDANDKLLATGCNDVPKFGGGLYGRGISPQEDHRCFNWKDGRCHNDAQKEVIYNEVYDRFFPAEYQIKDRPALRQMVKDGLQRTRVKDLIEFSRSVHAEMDALVSVARHGTGSTLGGTLFSKTFPCHNCARHIVVSGIRRVIFVEPYPKSLALSLHEDSITVKEEDAGKAVLFQQYEGVSPQVFSRFFASDGLRKDNGFVVKRNPLDALPVGHPDNDLYLQLVSKYGMSEPLPSHFSPDDLQKFQSALDPQKVSKFAFRRAR